MKIRTLTPVMLICALAIALVFASSAAAAVTITVTKAQGQYYADGDSTAYNVQGTVTGWTPPNYKLTVDVRNSSDGVLATTGQLTKTTDAWSVHLVHSGRGGAKIKVCVDDTKVDCVETAIDYLPPIPTLSEWALIIFGVLLLGMMTYYVVRRRRATQSAGI